jgi:hypothetical protein
VGRHWLELNIDRHEGQDKMFLRTAAINWAAVEGSPSGLRMSATICRALTCDLDTKFDYLNLLLFTSQIKGTFSRQKPRSWNLFTLMSSI